MELESSPGPSGRGGRVPALKRAASSLSLDSSPADRHKRARRSYDVDSDDDFDEMDIIDRAPSPVSKEHKHTLSAAVVAADAGAPPAVHPLLDELEEELTCGCCSALCYNPVSVAPCSHFFCGSCFTHWVANGGSHCPVCRTQATAVTPDRALQRIIDIVAKHHPAIARTAREKQQADEVYRAGRSIRLPTPREATPEPNISNSGSYYRPCITCTPGNPYNWRCPVPIADPVLDPTHAISSANGDLPAGHAYCANCDMLHATRAPMSSQCDFCRNSFCGVGVAERCSARSLRSQTPQGFSDVSDLLEASDVYDVFQGNTYEVEILFDYLLRNGEITTRSMYAEMIVIMQTNPESFSSIVAPEAGSDDSTSSAASNSLPRRRVCRECAGQLFVDGLMKWWIAERVKGKLDAHVANRPKCEHGSACTNQADTPHAKQFNHIEDLPRPEAAPETASAPEPVSALEPVTAPEPVSAPEPESVSAPLDAATQRAPSIDVALAAFHPPAEFSPAHERAATEPAFERAVREGASVPV